MTLRVLHVVTGEPMTAEEINGEIEATEVHNRVLEHILAPGRTESLRLGGVVRGESQNERTYQHNLNRLEELKRALADLV